MPFAALNFRKCYGLPDASPLPSTSLPAGPATTLAPVVVTTTTVPATTVPETTIAGETTTSTAGGVTTTAGGVTTTAGGVTTTAGAAITTTQGPDGRIDAAYDFGRYVNGQKQILLLSFREQDVRQRGEAEDGADDEEPAAHARTPSCECVMVSAARIGVTGFVQGERAFMTVVL